MALLEPLTMQWHSCDCGCEEGVCHAGYPSDLGSFSVIFPTNAASDFGTYDVYVDASSHTYVDGSYLPRYKRPTNW